MPAERLRIGHVVSGYLPMTENWIHDLIDAVPQAAPLVLNRGRRQNARALASEAFEVVVIGDGPERTGLEILRDVLGLQDLVTFVGAQPIAAVQASMQQTDVQIGLRGRAGDRAGLLCLLREPLEARQRAGVHRLLAAIDTPSRPMRAARRFAPVEIGLALDEARLWCLADQSRRAAAALGAFLDRHPDRRQARKRLQALVEDVPAATDVPHHRAAAALLRAPERLAS